MRILILTVITTALLINGNAKAETNLNVKDIRQKIQNANYCKTKEDCVTAWFECPFGCGAYINKNEEAALKKTIEEYLQKSNLRCDYQCAMRPAPDCINGHCTEPSGK
jgi:hypothetical protein